MPDWRRQWCAWAGRDNFIEHGKTEALREKYGLTADAAFEKVLPLLHRTGGGGRRRF